MRGRRSETVYLTVRTRALKGLPVKGGSGARASSGGTDEEKIRSRPAEGSLASGEVWA